MPGPDSSYSCLLIHICWKVDREARIDPPIQTEYLRSGGATILIFMVLGARKNQLLLHAVSDAREHRSATRQNDVGVEILADINIALHDGVVGSLSNTNSLHADEGRLEQNLRAAEALVADSDHLTVRQLVALLQGRGLSSSLHLLLEVEGDVAQLLLDVTDDFHFSAVVVKE
eukprot:JZ554464.1.p1 GENE.JZ554464.1~~JZ554464.1.p1  ORF type:complete len:173 (-),score=62.42 JZ554464.1:5-523(-)